MKKNFQIFKTQHWDLNYFQVYLESEQFGWVYLPAFRWSECQSSWELHTLSVGSLDRTDKKYYRIECDDMVIFFQWEDFKFYEIGQIIFSNLENTEEYFEGFFNDGISNIKIPSNFSGQYVSTYVDTNHWQVRVSAKVPEKWDLKIQSLE